MTSEWEKSCENEILGLTEEEETPQFSEQRSTAIWLKSLEVGRKEKIQTYESTISSQSKEISSLDSLAHVLGSQEHCGRVRGLGLGPCPSKVFGVHARSHFGSSSSTPSNVELQAQVSSLTSSNVKLESQVSSLTSQVNEMKAMMTLLLQNHQGSLPSQFVVFQRSSVSDQGSGPNNRCNEEEN
ncbi:uncharacterized protein LOC124829484 [Vigna umbellata]|uniref:uncharacterized protein LOC124829484 n=1 Tax=Vigna umbellata TaxID=87088 RepID=UPI001F5EF4A3|nr:uncharacterized protein LOC124829484 [Vigna umbellata]